MELLRYTWQQAAGNIFIALAVIAALVFAGCGGSATHLTSTTVSGASGAQSQGAPTTTPGSLTAPPVKAKGRSEPSVTIAIGVKIPGAAAGQPLPKRYTCDGEDVSLPVEWRGVPHDTAELVLSVESTKLVNGKHLFFNWAVAGLSPTSNGVSAGTLPAGAIEGRNGFGKIGYSICPPKGKSETFLVRVSALTKSIAAKPGFDPETLLTEGEQTAKVIGLGGTSYTRQ